MPRILIFSVLVWVFAPLAAQAQHTGVVLDFEGRGAAAARRVVVRSAQAQIELIPRRTVERSARDLGVDLSTQEGRSAIAAELRVSIFITGVVSGRGSRQRAIILVLDAEGEEVGRKESRFPRGGRGARLLGRAADELLGETIVELDRRAEEQRQQELVEDRQEIATIDEELLQGDDEDDDEPSEPTDFPLVEGLLGFGGRTRAADINLANGATRVYDAGFFPELSLRVTAHPLASDGGALAGIFFQLDGALALGLSSVDERDPANPDDDIEFGTSVLRWMLVAGYLHQLGNGMMLGGGLGFGVDSFSLDANDIMSSTSYTNLRLGAIGRIPIMDEETYDLFFQLDAGVRLVFGTGDLAPFFAESASATGLDVMGSLGGALDMGLAYALRFGLTSWLLSFEGDALMAANTANDGSDTAFVFQLQAGWQLR